MGKIIYLRQNYHFGPGKIAMYLHRYHDIEISKSGVWQILQRLEPGALADLAVLDADPFSIDPDRLPEVRSDLTLVGGKPAHIGPPFIGALG